MRVIDQTRSDIAALCRQSGARRLDAFGSSVRADFDPVRSDFDFVVEFDDLPPADYAASCFGLKEGLERLLGRSVDLLTERSLRNPCLRQRIDADRVPVHAR